MTRFSQVEKVEQECLASLLICKDFSSVLNQSMLLFHLICHLRRTFLFFFFVLNELSELWRTLTLLFLHRCSFSCIWTLSASALNPLYKCTCTPFVTSFYLAFCLLCKYSILKILRVGGMKFINGLYENVLNARTDVFTLDYVYMQPNEVLFDVCLS